MDAQKKTPLPVAAEQEGDTSSLAPNIVNQPSQSVKTSDSGLLAPGEPLLDVLDNQIAIITDNYCGTIDSLCADSTGLEIRWHDDTQKGQLIIRVEPKEE